ncbi:hypothetical protein D9M69_663010 [compost metagenome]
MPYAPLSLKVGWGVAPDGVRLSRMLSSNADRLSCSVAPAPFGDVTTNGGLLAPASCTSVMKSPVVIKGWSDCARNSCTARYKVTVLLKL